MEILKGGAHPRGPTVITIGNFDGVHRGHQALIQAARQLADARGQELVAMTFEPHPSLLLRAPQAHFLITPLAVKLDFMAWAGASAVSLLPFTREFAAMAPETFLEDILGRQYQATAVVVGYNFTFGRGGVGNVDQLSAWGAHHGVEIRVMPPFLDTARSMAVSSSRIRQEIRAGHIAVANELLGHPFVVSERVIRGDQRGRQMAVPTLNVSPPVEQVMPPYGVYAGYVTVAGQRLMAVASWGVRPTFEGIEPILEVHALEPLEFGHYGQVIRFEWQDYLREELRFDSSEALMVQIGHDIAEARQRLQSRA